MELKFRKLRADEIDCRVSRATQKGIILLLYKDARVDQNILDETVGPMNWTRRHEIIGGNLFCTVGIRDEHLDEWTEKQDVGTESNTEKEKGQASDAFKRACFNWGIGRELYTAPNIFIHDGQYKKNDKGTTYDRFRVSKIGYDDGVISLLTIVNESMKNREVFHFEGGVIREDPVETPPVNANEKITSKQVLALKELCKKHGFPEEKVAGRYGRTSLEEMTVGDWADFHRNGADYVGAWDKEAGNDSKDGNS